MTAAPAGATPSASRVGTLRPSQLMYAYGVGAMLDLPQISVIVSGLCDWDPAYQRDLAEDRLLAALRLTLGPQIKHLKTAPWAEETRDPLDAWARVGVPVMPFPRWLRCTKCGLLTHIDAKLFKLHVNPYRPEHTRYEHDGCGGDAVSARFVLACPAGHLDEFPWVEFCHEGTPCQMPLLKFEDIGTGIGGSEAYVRCTTCETKRHLALAFGERAAEALPRCRGRHPHLRAFDAAGCKLTPRAMILGASNQWFPLSQTVLSIPASKEPLAQVVDELWPHLIPVTAQAILAYAVQNVPDLRKLRAYPVDAIWDVVEQKRAGGAPPPGGAGDLLSPEWRVLSDPANAPESPDFRVREGAVPGAYASVLERIVLVERLREVTALCGFTRVEGPDWDPGSPPGAASAPITTGKPTWVPAAESRGEGLFLQLREDAVQAWEAAAENSPRMGAIRAAHERWRQRRNMDPGDGWRGARFVLLHTLAHAVINELALECGYSAASIRERIYSLVDGGGGATMAGILLYTAAPDSEGTLGGLVGMGAPETLERLLRQALGRWRLCASDPLCAEHVPDVHEDTLHGAACHACAFVPETSCQAGNRYLDRAVLVPTMAHAGIEFFPA